MKALSAVLLLLLLMALPVPGEAGVENIWRVKVLIIEEGFKGMPEEGEKLTLLEKSNGDLVVGGNVYSGDIEVWSGEKGIYLINDLPLEEYVEGVVKAESGEEWDLEALKAQAIVVRTYIANRILNRSGEKYDVTSSVLHQLYKGRNNDTMVTEAVRATKGLVVTYDGLPIKAYYHSTCGGRTEDPGEVFGEDLPYLRPAESSCVLSPLSAWARRIPLAEIQKATDTKGITEIKIASRTSTGRARTLEITANPSMATVEAKELRRALGWYRLPSTNFTVSVEGDSAVFEGKGYGHGVGLCQWSALEMALDGKSFGEIISFYYPGTRIEQYENLGF